MVMSKGYWINALFGTLFFLSVIGNVAGVFVWGGDTTTPTPFSFDLDEDATGFREDGYHLVGYVNKIEDCARLEAPAGFAVQVEGTAAGDTYNADWHSALGNDRDQSREQGTNDPLHIIIDLPEAYGSVRVYAAHACPRPESLVDEETGEVSDVPITYIQTIFHEIPGNIETVRSVTFDEATGG